MTEGLEPIEFGLIPKPIIIEEYNEEEASDVTGALFVYIRQMSELPETSEEEMRDLLKVYNRLNDKLWKVFGEGFWHLNFKTELVNETHDKIHLLTSDWKDWQGNYGHLPNSFK